MILQPINAECVADFKATRLRALADAPTAFGSTHASESRLTDTQWIERAGQWSSARSRGLLAFDSSTPCGIAGCFLDADDPHKAMLISMWVAPTYRRHGVGRILVDAIADWAALHGARALHLHVTSNNAAGYAFYERLGFAATGKTEPYPNDPGLVEVEMVRPTALAK